jgi:hypothetical protein
MSQAHVFKCDNCGRESHDKEPQGWGVLQTKLRRMDVCSACIAKMEGWDNPKVAGTEMRAREWQARVTKVTEPRRVQITGAL